MKKHLLALAALAAVSGVASAQSVTVYGTMDVGITSANKNAAASATAGTKTSMESGGIAPSVFGFKGTEDLGGGLKASFALEGHLDSSTGQKNDLSTTSGQGLFARQANLNLSGDFGSLTLGRQFTPAVLAFAATDPRGLRESYSGLQLFAVTAPATNANSHAGIFASNAVGYSKSLGPVSVSAMRALGEVAGNASINTLDSFGVVYTGPVTLSAGYESSKDNDTNVKDTTKSTFGAAYALGNLTIKANTISYKVKTSGAESEVFGFGGEYKLTPNSNVTAAYYDGKAKATGAKAKSYVASYEYAFSKRTTAYAQYAAVEQNATSTNLNVLAVATVANKTASNVNVGIKHSF
jgi:predicted porin